MEQLSMYADTGLADSHSGILPKYLLHDVECSFRSGTRALKSTMMVQSVGVLSDAL